MCFFIISRHKYFLWFLSFLDTEMAQVVEILSHRKPVYWACTVVANYLVTQGVRAPAAMILWGSCLTEYLDFTTRRVRYPSGLNTMAVFEANIYIISKKWPLVSLQCWYYFIHSSRRNVFKNRDRLKTMSMLINIHIQHTDIIECMNSSFIMIVLTLYIL